MTAKGCGCADENFYGMCTTVTTVGCRLRLTAKGCGCADEKVYGMCTTVVTYGNLICVDELFKGSHACLQLRAMHKKLNCHLWKKMYQTMPSFGDRILEARRKSLMENIGVVSRIKQSMDRLSFYVDKQYAPRLANQLVAKATISSAEYVSDYIDITIGDIFNDPTPVDELIICIGSENKTEYKLKKRAFATDILPTEVNNWFNTTCNPNHRWSAIIERTFNDIECTVDYKLIYRCGSLHIRMSVNVMLPTTLAACNKCLDQS